MEPADHNSLSSHHSESEPSHTSTPEALGDASILGLDNVPLDLRLAGLGTRSFAMLVDGVALLLLLVVWGLFMAALVGFWGPDSSWLWIVAGFGYFFLQWGYFSACEILMDGKTPGKMVMSLQTVSHVGGQPLISAIVIRNLLRPIDYFFGVFFMAWDRRSRRLGDMVASTLVVHRRDLSPTDDFRLGRVPVAWNAEQVLLVESFLRRASRMEPEIAQELAGKLVQWIERTEADFFESSQPLPEEDQADLGGVPINVHRLCALLAVQSLEGSSA